METRDISHEYFFSAWKPNNKIMRLKFEGISSSVKPRWRAWSKLNFFPFSPSQFSWEHELSENLPMVSAKHLVQVLMETFFETRNFRKILRWRGHKESSHVTCHQACRSFEIFIIYLAFQLIQKVNATAITVKSTSRELNGESFSTAQVILWNSFLL